MMTTMEDTAQSVTVTVDFGDGQTYTWKAHAMIDIGTLPEVTISTSDGRPVKVFTSDNG